MKFAVLATDGAARRGRLTLSRGTVETPAFMPCATRGSVMALSPADVEALGFEMILMNAYHLHLRPGEDYVRERGGVHRLFRWERPVLTDSGGFQVFSLGARCRVDEEGVTFASHLDGSAKRLTPESVLGIQRALGSDIWMPLDHCAPGGADAAFMEQAAARTLRWAEISRRVHAGMEGEKGALFGIVQGGTDLTLRKRCAEDIAALDFEGHSVGGLSVGEEKGKLLDAVALMGEILPREKPRYLMGVGTPEDLVEGVARGVDLFDCVFPTRNARNGTLYTWSGKISLKRKEFAGCDDPPDADCPCFTCRNFSLAYLRLMWRQGEISSMRLNSIHNLAFYAALMRAARESVAEGRFEAWRRDFLARYREGATPSPSASESAG